MKTGRNDPCPCEKKRPDGKPIKYKKCCMRKDENAKKIDFVARNIFISGPYRDCPNPKCNKSNTYGVDFVVVGSSGYSRKCTECGHTESHSFPKIKKKVVYLDQFVISELVKLLDKSHPSHQKIKSDPFWEKLFIKLEAASRSQAIVCPDSFYHKDETFAGKIDFGLMKRLLEHFSSGKTLEPSGVVERIQIVHHFEKWLDKTRPEFDFSPENIAFGSGLHAWSAGNMQISVSGGPYPGQIENIRKTNTTTKESLEAIWKRWQSERDVNFEDRVIEETLGLWKGYITAGQNFKKRRAEAMQKMASGQKYNLDLDDIMPPMFIDTFERMAQVAKKKRVPEAEIPNLLVTYFNDAKTLLEIPSIKIGSVMFAGLARLAALGKKRPQKSTTDVIFISSYLPYCDAMFIDKESALLLEELPRETPKYLRLDEFGTKIFSRKNREDLLDYLDKLVQEIPKEQIDILKDMSGEDYHKPFWEIIEHEKTKC